MTRIMSIMVVLTVIALLCAPAQGQGVDKYFCADTDNKWSGDNWREFAVGQDCTDGTSTDPPTAADRAIIVSGKTCNIASAAVADSLEVESTATLNIEGASGNSLTLDDTDANGSTINGTLNLEGSNSVLAFTTNDQTIAGTGKIVGKHNSAKITITVGETLTNDTTIEGKLEITDDTSSGTFKNEGTVHANTNGTLKITTQDMDDVAGALWKVSTVTVGQVPVLLIDPGTSTELVLDGDFDVRVGKLDIRAPGLDTTGDLTQTGGGTIVVESGLTVSFSQ